MDKKVGVEFVVNPSEPNIATASSFSKLILVDVISLKDKLLYVLRSKVKLSPIIDGFFDTPYQWYLLNSNLCVFQTVRISVQWI